MEFHILDAPHECEDSSPRDLAERGFKMPFKAWMNIGEWKTDKETGLSKRMSPNIVYGIEKSILYVLDQMK